MNKIKDLLAEIERAKKEAITEFAKQLPGPNPRPGKRS